MAGKIVLVLVCISIVNAGNNIKVKNPNSALDNELYEKVLDPVQCQNQIEVLQINIGLLMQFYDAGVRFPRGITLGNFLDLGSYDQCLNIRHEAEEMQIQGKYCLIRVSMSQNLTVPWDMKWSGFDPTALVMDEETASKVQKINSWRAESSHIMGMSDGSLSRTGSASTPLGDVSLTLAICIPKPCLTEEAISSLFFNASAIGFQYEDEYCRLSDDKPWSPADTAATIILSVIGILTLLCTSYDLLNKFVFRNDPKLSHPLYTSFSVYTNGRRLTTFSSNPGTLQCLDGIRTWAMVWVVLGHSFQSEMSIINFMDSMTWMTSIESLWIRSAPLSVDTFLCLSGVVLVYSTAGKMKAAQLFKSLHLFYLNRFLRLAPLLAIVVLLQASFFNRMLDGPVWTKVISQTNNCRTNWWLTLLHLQNYINSDEMCLSHSWYVAIDFQCYLVSPLVLFWVLGRSPKMAWAGLIGTLLVALTGGGVYSFINDFPSGMTQPGHPGGFEYFMKYYYTNTLTRAGPFFVGMICGYVLHFFKGKKLTLSYMSVASLWACTAAVSTTIFFYPTFIADFQWDNQFVDNLMNTFMRPAWGAAICWMIIACVHGYGGPINWFLTLDMWKLPARISYAIFLVHYPMMFVINGSGLSPVYFSVSKFMFNFLGHMSLSLVLAFFLTLLIDSPCSTICKQLLDSKKKKPAQSTISTKAEYQNGTSTQMSLDSTEKARFGNQAVNGSNGHGESSEVVIIK